jgi:hypothetical protein
MAQGREIQFPQHCNVVEKVNSISPPKSVVRNGNIDVNL